MVSELILLRVYNWCQYISVDRKGAAYIMEVIEDMAISEKELKLLLNFIKDNLQEARETKDEENRNKQIDKTLEHIQQYLED